MHVEKETNQLRGIRILYTLLATIPLPVSIRRTTDLSLQLAMLKGLWYRLDRIFPRVQINLTMKALHKHLRR